MHHEATDGSRLRAGALPLPLIPLFTVLSLATVNAASLGPATLNAWEEYVESANKRMEQRLGPDKTFLWVDEAPDRAARARAGEVIVSPVGPQNPPPSDPPNVAWALQFNFAGTLPPRPAIQPGESVTICKVCQLQMAVPEPTSVMVAICGFLPLALARRWRR